MIILGIDPGLADLGWGVIESSRGRHRHLGHGVIQTSAREIPEQRLLKIFEGIQALIRQFQVTCAGLETLFFVKNITSALPVAEARGVVRLALALAGIPIGEYNPTAIKNALVGVGRAEKAQVQEMVRLLLGLDQIPEPNHAADALAAAICHSHYGGSFVQQPQR